jgi:hypothetical protein
MTGENDSDPQQTAAAESDRRRTAAQLDWITKDFLRRLLAEDANADRQIARDAANDDR